MPSGRNIGFLSGGVGALLLATLGAWNWSNNGRLKLWVEGIRAIDFRNYVVDVSNTACADPQLTQAGIRTLPLRDGSFRLGQYHLDLISDARFGDVSGNTGGEGGDKAAFVANCASGEQSSQVLFVYGLESGGPTRLGTADLPGTTNGFVQAVGVRDGEIEIHEAQGSPPTFTVLTYALIGGTLQSLGPTGPSVVRDIDQSDLDDATTAANDLAAGDDKINYQYFKDKLSSHGNWIKGTRWGTVWQPNEATRQDFRPYQDGHWENTQEYGTVWVSDYEWGDIPFHYGRWAFDRRRGWLWVPGYVWGPGWVVWRAGDGNVGWFPMPPTPDFDATIDYVDDWNDWYGYRLWYGTAFDPALFYGMWTFVPAVDLYFPNIARFALDRRTYGRFIVRTRPWTHFVELHGHVFNRSIDPVRFRETFGRPLAANARHDFHAHRGPMTSIEGGHRIASKEPLAHGGTQMEAPPRPPRHRPPTETGDGRGNPFTRDNGERGNDGEGTFTTDRDARGPGSDREQRPSRESGFGGQESEHNPFGGGSAEHAGFGGHGGERPAFGGGPAQRPAFGGGSGFPEQSRQQPMSTGSVHTAAPQSAPKPANSSQHH